MKHRSTFIAVIVSTLVWTFYGCGPSVPVVVSPKDAAIRIAVKQPAPLARNIELPAIFSDHMVVQRGRSIPVWGTATPGGEVTARLGSMEQKTIAGEDGNWRIDFESLKGEGPFELVISGEERITFENVLNGEVWVCSGQSNMEWSLKRTDNAEAEIQNATHKKLRLLTVEKGGAYVPRFDAENEGWAASSPEVTRDFSAVCYYFGRAIHQALGVPVGLIHSSWGGSKAEAWVSPDVLSKMPDFKDAVAPYKSRGKYSRAAEKEAWSDRLTQFLGEEITKEKTSPGAKWGQVGKPTGFKPIPVPAAWEKKGLPDFDGVVYLQKDIVIPKSWDGTDVSLHIGRVDNMDITYVNGVHVGQSKKTKQKRRYPVPADVLRPGKNTITICVLNYGGDGGLRGKRNEYQLNNDRGDSLSLSGKWFYKPGPSVKGTPLIKSYPPYTQHAPALLYNAMIAPIIPYGIRGVTWYQGEANTPRAYQYRNLFKTLIENWRDKWGQGTFPFYFVQLANFMKVSKKPEEHPWAELREAQSMALSLPETGMAVTIDIGEGADIHPGNKKDVGERLAKNALNKTYGKDVPFSGPVFKSMDIEGKSVRVHFSNTYGGLVARALGRNEKLMGFAIAAEDKKFYFAKARIDGDTVVISHPKVKNPAAIRYAWAANPVCNLYNKAGLPASPFRTDQWPGITENNDSPN